MAQHRRGRLVASSPYHPKGEEGRSDRIPYADRVDPSEPARTNILLTIHKFTLAGVEIDDRAVDIATQLGRWEHEDALNRHPVEPGDVPRWKKTFAELDNRQQCVYYVRRANMVKIGYTVDLTTRMIALRPNEILAIEPGNEQLERERHKQFRDLRIEGEYFHPGKALQDHILAVREEFGPPQHRAGILSDGQDYFQRG